MNDMTLKQIAFKVLVVLLFAAFAVLMGLLAALPGIRERRRRTKGK